MRYVLNLLGWYVDLLIFLTISFLARSPFSFDPQWFFFAELIVFLIFRFVVGQLAMTPGQWMLAPAAEERLYAMESETGPVPRQWPNLLAGTLFVLEGTKSMVRWLEMDRPIPFMGFVPEGAAQAAIGVGMGALFVVAGAGLLRIEPLGKYLAGVLVAITAISTALSWAMWDTLIERIVVARRTAQGVPVRPDEIEFMQNLVPELFVIPMVLFALLLLFCRTERSY